MITNSTPATALTTDEFIRLQARLNELSAQIGKKTPVRLCAIEDDAKTNYEQDVYVYRGFALQRTGSQQVLLTLNANTWTVLMDPTAAQYDEGYLWEDTTPAALLQRVVAAKKAAVIAA